MNLTTITHIQPAVHDQLFTAEEIQRLLSAHAALLISDAFSASQPHAAPLYSALLYCFQTESLL